MAMRMGRVSHWSRVERDQRMQQCQRLLAERNAEPVEARARAEPEAAPCVPRTLSLFCTSTLVLCHSARLSQSHGDLTTEKLTPLGEEEEDEEDEEEEEEQEQVELRGFYRPYRRSYKLGKLDAGTQGMPSDEGTKGVCVCSVCACFGRPYWWFLPVSTEYF